MPQEGLQNYCGIYTTCALNLGPWRSSLYPEGVALLPAPALAGLAQSRELVLDSALCAVTDTEGAVPQEPELQTGAHRTHFQLSSVPCWGQSWSSNQVDRPYSWSLKSSTCRHQRALWLNYSRLLLERLLTFLGTSGGGVNGGGASITNMGRCCIVCNLGKFLWKSVASTFL